MRLIAVLSSFALVAIGVAGTGLSLELLAPVYLAAITPWLVLIDLREHRLPNRLVVPGIGVGVLGFAGEWIVAGAPNLVPVVAGLAYSAFLAVLHFVGGMGLGDVKLGAVLGLASWTTGVAVLSPVIAFLVGGLVAAAFLLAGRRGRRIAFGPYLLGGYWAALALVAASTIAG